MNNKVRNVITICADMIMLAIVAIASYFLLMRGYDGWRQYLLQGIIIVLIPTMFFISYMTFAGHKYDAPDEEQEEEDETLDETEQSEQKERENHDE